MTAANNLPTCPACKQPCVNAAGNWQICVNCPYRDVAGSADDAHPDIETGEEVTVTLNVPLLFRRLAEQAMRIRELERELAEFHFKNTGTK